MIAGLSFGVDALLELDGTLLLEEIVQAKEVVNPLILFLSKFKQYFNVEINVPDPGMCYLWCLLCANFTF